MARSFNQKQKLLFILDTLKEKSDETHVLNVNYIINLLESNGIKAERKSVYDDIESLSDYGYDIVLKKGRNGGYYLKSREFNTAELKILADAVQSSEFITDNKSRKLISKLKNLANEYEGKELQGQIIVKKRIKTMHESIYNDIDKIHSAILHNNKIRFNSYKWVIKDAKFKKSSKAYEISPWIVFLDDNKYYLIGYDSEAENIKHFRIDKMININTTEKLREGEKVFNKFDHSEYADNNIGLNGGRYQNVKLNCNNELIDEIIDRFGKNIELYIKNENTFCTDVNVQADNRFFGWITGLGSGITIESPGDVVNEYKSYINEILKKY